MAHKIKHTATAAKNPANEPKQIIIQQLEVRKATRTEQDIPKWRNAIKSAEGVNPRRQLLYDLYADVELDGHVESVVSKRTDAVCLADWHFVDKDGSPIEEINQLIDTIGFGEMIEEIVKTRFWGYSIFEPKFWKGLDDKWQMNAGLLPRLHYRPEAGIVTYQRYGEDGVDIRSGRYLKTVMEVGKVDDMGLYVKAAPYAILKRGGIGDWAAFIQTFGSPLIDATWDGFDETQKAALQDALNGLGPGGTIIRPDGTEISIIENKAKDTSDAHGSFTGFLNKEISKSLLGTTETTESSTSSGYAQSKTHDEQDNDKHDSDLQFTRRYLNSRFIRVLNAYGFDTKGGEFTLKGDEHQLDKTQQFNIVSTLMEKHKLPVDHDYLYETFGIPKPDNYEQLLKEQAQQEAAEPTPKKPNTKATREEQEGKKAAKTNKENKDVSLDDAKAQSGIIRAYNNFVEKLLGFFVKAPQDGAMLQSCTHHHTTITLSNGINSDTWLRQFWEGKNKSFSSTLFYYHSSNLTRAFKEGWGTGNTVQLTENPGFAYGGDDPAMLTAFEQNLFKFAGAKTLAQIQELNQFFRQSKSFEEFYQMAKPRTELYNTAWLQTEYATAVLTGEAAATYQRLKAQIDLFPYWKYTTVGDELVRPAHRLLDGLILPATDKIWQKLFPPNAWRCRCRVVPLMAHEVDASLLGAMQKRAKAYLDSTMGQMEKDQGWHVNRANSGEVFLANQMYTGKFPGKAQKSLAQLKPQDWGLQAYSQAKKAGKGVVKTFDGDRPDQAQLKDYNNRPVVVNKSGGPNALYLGMQEALHQPDEVWYQGKDLTEVYYVKYYKDQTLVTVAKVAPTGMQILNWYTLEETRKSIDLVRRGLLTYVK
ncbi:DUF935 family protein [Croceivirga sp. JEA036]|uniref:phage portal protein family protein n=1 Tax=Croceivirga sp. JEA036 TaxID=2721162 RepID=UPI00143885E9|nr:DUF935 family protein [Croceivirga sp. JEA036]NJB36380.1 DUF935 family protein [Croceivirga sp. JEA036]